MKKFLLIPVVAGCFVLGGCSAQQVTSTAMGAAGAPVQIVGAAASAAGGVAGAALGRSVAGSVGTALGGAIGTALVKGAF